MSVSLPNDADESALAARREELAKRQSEYIYESPPTIPGIAFLKGPVDKMPGEMPRFSWFARVGFVSARVTLNFSGFTPSAIIDSISVFLDSLFVDKSNSAAVDDAGKRFTAKKNQKAVADAVRKRFANARMGSTFEEANPMLEMYRDMYSVLPMPEIGNIFLEDRVFSRLRVAGFNPISLFRVDSADKAPFQIDAGRMPTEGDTMEAAAAEGRLFALDFSVLSSVPQKPAVPEQIVVPSKALFALPPGSDGPNKLVPVAIELPTGIVYPPRAGEEFTTRWAIAKMIINNCDAVHHELVAHLGRTHLLVEPFVAATMRQLPAAHPVHRLMRPHFEGTVFINDTASRNLVAPGGDVDTVFAGDIAAVMAWCGKVVVDTPFNQCFPDVEMKARGVHEAVLESPYREDALEHFDALVEWTTAYLKAFYASDEQLRADAELAAWVEELVDPARGRVKDFGDGGSGKVQTIDYLGRALAFVIFSGSVQHAAVNFPQRALMSYAPAVAGAMWSPPPGGDEKANLEKWSEMLTPLEVAVDQVEILNVIGAVYHTKLGKYRGGELPSNSAVSAGLAQYRKRLDAIDARIAKREANEELKYEYLRPDNVPQSINI